ncbi:MAG: chemotaxis-specific protein-glutamate methyltransferase CheB [Chloroflexi bacterium]|nr:chemotaxis-specific protein-glutamate methyltransferase CheB [Chloroflexota bacterium]
MIRVLIVDDSAIFRSALKTALESDADIRVVGQAANGSEAVELVTRLEPDLVTLDVNMPGLDSFQTVEQIMARRPTPILIIADVKRETLIFRMLAAGALDVLTKPDHDPAAMRPIVDRVKGLALAHAHSTRLVPSTADSTAQRPTTHRPTGGRGSGPVVIIVSSAGGPPALAQVLAQLPADMPAAVLIVQHIAPGFAPGMAKWLSVNCLLPVQLAEADQVLQAGVVGVAPDNAHLVVAPGRRLLLDQSIDAHSSLRPAADVTLRSAAEVCGADLLAVVLTGMGRDGAAGTEIVKARGGRVVVQDQATSAVYGMPQAARQFADAELPLQDIAAYIIRFVYDHVS